MNTHEPLAPADWAEMLATSVRQTLGGMSTSLTLSEAKMELGRRLRERRTAWERGQEAVKDRSTQVRA